VTGLDGQYQVKRIPVGKVHVGVLLPVLGKTEERDLEIKEGDNTLDLTLHFDAAKDMPAPRAAARDGGAPGPAGSAAPSAGPSATVKKPTRFR